MFPNWDILLVAILNAAKFVCVATTFLSVTTRILKWRKARVDLGPKFNFDVLQQGSYRRGRLVPYWWYWSVDRRWQVEDYWPQKKHLQTGSGRIRRVSISDLVRLYQVITKIYAQWRVFGDCLRQVPVRVTELCVRWQFEELSRGCCRT